MARIFALIVLAVLATTTSTACQWSTSDPEVDVNAAGLARAYVDVDVCGVTSCLPSPWIYLESNGLSGLQRSDERVDDTCGGAIRADRLLF